MVSYKIDKQMLMTANTQMRDMASVLVAIPESLKTLQTTAVEQKEALSSPSINSYRDALIQKINEAIELTTAIANESEKLATVSDQAGKHLSAIEEHFGGVLRSNTETQQTV